MCFVPTVKVRGSPRCSCTGGWKGRTQVKGERGVHSDGIQGQPGCSYLSCEMRGPGSGVSLRGGWEARGQQQRHTTPAGHLQAALPIHTGSSDHALGSPLGPGIPPHLQGEGPSPWPCVVTISLSWFAPLTTEESFLCTALQVATRKKNLDTWEPELEFSSSSKCVVFDCVGAVEKFPLLVRSHLECIPYSAPRTEKWVHRLCAGHTAEY